MPRLLALCCVLLPCLIACSEEDPAPLFVQIDYQVRCNGCQPLSADDPEREISALDGERGFKVECATMARDGDRLATFSAAFTGEASSDNYGITVTQVNLDADEPGTSCRVAVTEGNNRYDATCSGDEPSADAPCQVDVDLDGDVIKGSVLCLSIPNRSSSMLTRAVVAPGTLDPAEFEVQGCTGL